VHPKFCKDGLHSCSREVLTPELASVSKAEIISCISTALGRRLGFLDILCLTIGKRELSSSMGKMPPLQSIQWNTVCRFDWNDLSFALRSICTPSKVYPLHKARISKNMQPRENISAGRPLDSDIAISGENYFGVPRSPLAV